MFIIIIMMMFTIIIIISSSSSSIHALLVCAQFGARAPHGWLRAVRRRPGGHPLYYTIDAFLKL